MESTFEFEKVVDKAAEKSNGVRDGDVELPSDAQVEA